MDGTWQLDWNGILKKSQFKRLLKHYPDEFASCTRNLKRVCDELDAGKSPADVPGNFYRPEGRGVFRIGQTKVRSAHELRLYVFPDERTRVLHVLCLGDKGTQQDDISLCRTHAATLQGESHEH